MGQTSESGVVTFQAKYDLKQRQKWLAENKKIYPEKISVIVLPFDGNACMLPNPKFLFPTGFSTNQIAYVLRSRLELTYTDSLFIAAVTPAIGYSQVTPGKLLSDIKLKHQHDDGFVYLVYSREQVFG